jgi:CMP-N-acetylneuraminic acid synthetase
MPEVLGVIPARGGSKGIPRKNLRALAGVPLIDYTFAAVHESKRLSRTILSTDDADIAARGRAAGIDVPFLRPTELARDDTPSLPVIQHAVGVLEASGYRPAIVVVLQPTSPLRRGEHIDGAVDLLLDGGADSVVSVVEVPHGFHPLSVLSTENGRLVPFLTGAPRDLFRRQDKPAVWARNGAAVYAVRRDVLMERDSLFGDDCRPYVMSRADSVDIDDDLDLLVAEAVLRHRGGGARP